MTHAGSAVLRVMLSICLFAGPVSADETDYVRGVVERATDRRLELAQRGREMDKLLSQLRNGEFIPSLDSRKSLARMGVNLLASEKETGLDRQTHPLLLELRIDSPEIRAALIRRSNKGDAQAAKTLETMDRNPDMFLKVSSLNRGGAGAPWDRFVNGAVDTAKNLHLSDEMRAAAMDQVAARINDQGLRLNNTQRERLLELAAQLANTKGEESQTLRESAVRLHTSLHGDASKIAQALQPRVGISDTGKRVAGALRASLRELGRQALNPNDRTFGDLAAMIEDESKSPEERRDALKILGRCQREGSCQELFLLKQARASLRDALSDEAGAIIEDREREYGIPRYRLNAALPAAARRAGPVKPDSPKKPREDSPPVRKLKELYKTDPAFRRQLELAFDHVQDQPDGNPNPWQGKNVEDLYNFFNDWFYFLPHKDDGLRYIFEFSWLYYKNPHGLKLVREGAGFNWTQYFVDERGKFMDSEKSKAVIPDWIADPATHIDQFVMPEGGYKSFNDFFTRTLKPGARPVQGVGDTSVIVSPADSIVNVIDNDLKADSRIPTKGRQSLNIKELLDGSPHAERFVGGSAVAFFLMPDSYHHFHAPVSGKLVESNQNVRGLAYGMENLPGMANRGNPGYGQDFSAFEDFRRGYFVIETQEHGHVGMIPVGLQTVGSVVFEKPFQRLDADKDKPIRIDKGAKLGHFAYGGSLVILLFEKDRFNAVKIKQGQQIGVFNK